MVSSDAMQLTYGQRALWYLNRLAPTSSAYNIGGAAWVLQGMDADRLDQAVGMLAVHHPWLGIRIEEVDGVPWARADARARPRLALVEVAATEDSSALVARASEIVNAPFDLTRGPLLRVALLRAADGRLVLVMAAHHIISDFAALGLLLHDLELFYAAACKGRDPGLPEPPGVARELAAREAQWISGKRSERALAHWRTQLGSNLPRLAIPADVDPAAASAGRNRLRGASLRRPLGAQRSARLRSFAAERKTTPFTVLASAFQVLLSRWSGQQEVLLGTPATARDAKTRGVVAYLVNPLAVRADLSGNPSFAVHLEHQRRAWFGALRHRGLPHPVLVERLSPQAADAHAPLFQAMFVFYGSHTPTERALLAFALGFGPPLPLGGWQLEPLALARSGAQLDLFLAAAEVEGRVVTELTYDVDRIDRGTAERLLESFAVLLEAAIEAPDTPVAALPLLGGAARAQRIAASSPAPAPGPTMGLDARVLEAAERAPEAVAVVDGERVWRYRQLVEVACQVADRLAALGIGAEDLVAVAAPRSAEMLAGLLGVMIQGAAYVPLDPTYPAARLRLILEDCSASAVLIQGAAPAALDGCSVPSVDLATIAPGAPARPIGPYGGSIDRLAYVIYTSGSTGRPKGVAITHRNADAMVRWAAEAFGPQARTGVLAATSICFDLSVFEIFATLALGGRVILASDALALPTLPAAAQVTLVNTVPSAASALVERGPLGAAVTHVCLAGEPLHAALVAAIHEQNRSLRVFNLYGPSEDTTYSTWAEIARGESLPPIGQPVAGSRAFVVDAECEPVPVGVVGEIVLGGAKVARGYLARPALTAERFIPDPLSGEPGGRLYRTGDLARVRADGELAFLGRSDHQIKVRGFRIELGEIEAALRAQRGIRQALVLARGAGDAGSVRLVAFVAADAGAAEPSALVAALAARLPAYMVPQHIERLDALPLLPNGKIDRRQLAERPIAIRRDPQAGDWVEPSTEVEEMLAAMWREVLGVERLGIYDSFFSLGGHSLLAMKVLARVREAFGIDLPLRALVEQPTIAGLSEAIARQMLEEADEETRAAVLAELDGATG